MKAFTYTRAQDAPDAVAQYRTGTAYLGGGTNLLDLMRLGVLTPDQLVDVSRLPHDQVEPVPGGRSADRGRGAQQRPGGPSAGPRALPDAGPGPAQRRLGTDPQHGHRRRKVRERASFAFALVSVAALIDVAGDGTVGTCRVALGGVAHAPWRAFSAERTLAGAPATAETFARAAAAELGQAAPLARNGSTTTCCSARTWCSTGPRRCGVTG